MTQDLPKKSGSFQGFRFFMRLDWVKIKRHNRHASRILKLDRD
jgi:hypothetical protein